MVTTGQQQIAQKCRFKVIFRSIILDNTTTVFEKVDWFGKGDSSANSFVQILGIFAAWPRKWMFPIFFRKTSEVITIKVAPEGLRNLTGKDVMSYFRSPANHVNMSILRYSHIGIFRWHVSRFEEVDGLGTRKWWFILCNLSDILLLGLEKVVIWFTIVVDEWRRVAVSHTSTNWQAFLFLFFYHDFFHLDLNFPKIQLLFFSQT